MATGLLPLVLGSATRLVRYLPSEPKVYRGRFELGWTSRSDDVTGERLSLHDGPLPDTDTVVGVSRELEGEQRQIPPSVSARKVGGVRLYRLARRGVAVAAPASTVVISGFEVVPTDDPATFRFRVEVSSGTYVRALVRDLGMRLGCGAVLAELRRTRIGPLRVEDAVALDMTADASVTDVSGSLIPLDAMPLTPPVVHLDEAAAAGFVHGRAVSGGGPSNPGPVRVVGPEGRLLGVADTTDGLIQPRVVLAEGQGDPRP
jgi:tRNA pseudouridine55 synthase